MLRIVCLRAGTAFRASYVTILHDMVRRNLAEGFEGEFVCFSDQPDDYGPGITVRPLPADLPGWWGKLSLFQDGLFPDGDRIIFFDLDSVLTGRLDELCAYDGPFAILRDFYRPDGYQSSVMAWEAGTNSQIWRSYELRGCPQDIDGGDQAWIEQRIDNAMILQDLFPELFMSFKAGNLAKNPPDKASVVVFHGHPRPHEVLTGWVPAVWKVGGLMRADLDAFCNVEHEQIIANVKSSIKRDIPWMDTAEPHDGHVCIVGGGPSLTSRLVDLQKRQSLGQKIWALNGAAKALLARGITVDAVIVCDARPENAEFVRGLSCDSYLASQCDPSVFDAANEPTLWHANTLGMEDALLTIKDKPVHLFGGGSTVGLNAMVLAFGLGYRKIHLYGMDSCYSHGHHHAYEQPLNEGENVVVALFNGKEYTAAPWMVQQVSEFQDLVPGLVADGCIITVAGDSLLSDVARNIDTTTPADIRAQAVLSRLQGVENPHGAEIGVFTGAMSQSLLAQNPHLSLIMVDSWEGGGAAYEGDSGDFHAGLTQDAQDGYETAARRAVAFAGPRASVIKARSADAAKLVLDGSLDFVFIDGDHSAEGCMRDIQAWAPKLKPGGLLSGHDYENTDFPKFGVTQAVNEFLSSQGMTLELGENFTWFSRIPATGAVANVGR